MTIEGSFLLWPPIKLNQMNAINQNLYNDLEKIIFGENKDEFKDFLTKVDPTKLNFFFLIQLFCNGAYVAKMRVLDLAKLMDPKEYDYDALLYVCNIDSRATENVNALIQLMPEEKKVTHKIVALLR